MSTEDVNTKNVKEEQKGEEHGHVHGENCDHGHDDEHHEESKGAKGEKKVRKALSKLGMTKIEGVNRVTVRQKDNYILLVKDPEVYTSGQTENTYIIFGELTMDDPKNNFMPPTMPTDIKPTVPTTESHQTVEIVGDDNEVVSEEGLNAADIETIMQETKVPRNKAAKALKTHEGDVVAAILALSG